MNQPREYQNKMFSDYDSILDLLQLTSPNYDAE